MPIALYPRPSLRRAFEFLDQKIRARSELGTSPPFPCADRAERCFPLKISRIQRLALIAKSQRAHRSPRPARLDLRLRNRRAAAPKGTATSIRAPARDSLRAAPHISTPLIALRWSGCGCCSSRGISDSLVHSPHRPHPRHLMIPRYDCVLLERCRQFLRRAARPRPGADQKIVDLFPFQMLKISAFNLR